MQQMSGGQALVRQLRAEGVDTVFALPGVQIMAAFDALYEARADIRMSTCATSRPRPTWRTDTPEQLESPASPWWCRDRAP